MVTRRERKREKEREGGGGGVGAGERICEEPEVSKGARGPEASRAWAEKRKLKTGCRSRC